MTENNLRQLCEECGLSKFPRDSDDTEFCTCTPPNEYVLNALCRECDNWMEESRARERSDGSYVCASCDSDVSEPVDTAIAVQLERGKNCPQCGEEIVRLEVSRLPIVAFKREMFEACFFENGDLPQAWRGNTVIAYHEDVEIVDSKKPSKRPE